MKSKEIFPEIVRDYLCVLQEDLTPEKYSWVEKNLSALEAAEQDLDEKNKENEKLKQEIQDNQNAHFDGIIERDEQIRKHISKIQELKKEIKEYKKLAQHNVPELVKLLKGRKG